MGTYGKASLVLIALLIVGGALACSQSSSVSRPERTPAATSASSTSTTRESGSIFGDRPPPSTSIPPYEEQSLFCTVDLADSWRSLLEQGRVSVPDGDRLVAVATAADGSQVFGSLYSQDWSGVVSVTPQGSITRIRAYADPTADQITGAAFDGRWLVWTESHSLTDWSDWDIRAWDSSTHQVVDIAAAPRVGGATVAGPFVIPVVSEGKAAWVQANQSGQGEVHLYSLPERRDRIVSAGKATVPVLFWGSNLLWGELDDPGERLGHLAMADAVSGERLALPEPLASIRHFGSVAASNEIVAWTDDLHSLSIWRPGEEKARRIFTADVGDGVDWIAIAGDLVTWSGVKTQWAADLRSQSVTRITRQYGSRHTNGKALLVSQWIEPLKSKESPPPSEIDVVDATRLPPLPGCGS